MEEFDKPDSLADAEMEWIAEARHLGVRLTNLTDGGEGAIGFRQSPETKEKRAAKARFRPNTKHTRKEKKPRHCRRGGFNPMAPCKAKPIVDSQGQVYSSVGEAANILGVDRALVRRVVQGKQLSARGLSFRFVEST